MLAAYPEAVRVFRGEIHYSAPHQFLGSAIVSAPQAHSAPRSFSASLIRRRLTSPAVIQVAAGIRAGAAIRTGPRPAVGIPDSGGHHRYADTAQSYLFLPSEVGAAPFARNCISRQGNRALSVRSDGKQSGFFLAAAVIQPVWAPAQLGQINS